MSAPLRPPTLGPRLRASLDGLAARIRFALAGRGAARLVGVLLVCCLISYALDRPLRLAWGTRLGLWLLAWTAALGVAWRRLARPLRRALPDVELARALEAAHPSLGWRVLSAVQFAGQSAPAGTSQELSAAVVGEAEALAASLDPTPVVPLQPVWKRLALAGLGALLLAALCWGYPSEAKTWAQRNLLLSQSARWPQDTYLQLVSLNGRSLDELAGVLAVPRGEDAELAVAVRAGLTPRRVYLEAEGLPGADAPSPFDDLGSEGGAARFRLRVERVPGDFRFWISGGDDRIGPFELRAIVPPFVEELELEAQPPAYTNRPARTFKLESASLSFPAGTVLAARVRVSKPLRRAWFDERSAGAAISTRVAAELSAPPGSSELRTLRQRWTIRETTQLTLGIEDADGAALLQPPNFSVIAIPDKPPAARLELSGVGLNVTPDATIGYRIGARDDYGLSGGRLHFDAAGRPAPKEGAPEPEGGWPSDEEQIREAAPALSGLEAEASGALELEGLRLVPKMSLRLWAVAQDNRPGPEPQLGNASVITLRVVSHEQLLNELLRRLFEERQLLEKLAGDEEDLARGQLSLDPQALARGPATQRDVARALSRSAKAVEQVVTELVSNKLLDAPTHARLRVEVVEALGALIRGALAEAASSAAAAAVAEGPAQASEAGEAARAARVVASEVRAIAEQLGRIEELAEIVGQLKRIIRRQRALLDRTRKTGGK